VLDRIGVSNAVLEKADSPPAVLMIDALNGKEITRVPTRASFRARFRYPYIIIHRIDLHNVMLDACQRDPLVTLAPDAMVLRFDDRGDGVNVTTEDGRSFQGAALIAIGKQLGACARAETVGAKHIEIAVGTRVTSRPPHRAVRARFGHTAPTLGA
jgi:hypothetical protein